MSCVRIEAPPDPMSIARALSERPGLAVLASRPDGAWRAGDARYSFVACDPCDASGDWCPAQSESDERGYGGAPAPPRWIGVVPYEATRGIERSGWTRHPDDRPAPAIARPAWRRYRAVVRIDHGTGEVSVEGDDRASVADLARAVASGASHRPAFALDVLECDEPDDAHVARVRAALDLIARGDLYEVNLARRIPLRLRGHALALFASLLDAAPAPWSYFHDLGDAIVCGASPELALSVHRGALRTCPIKGTRPRGRDARDDERLARQLDADPKERAELVMAVDVHRNDLGRVAQPGSVRLFEQPRVVAGRTVWSRGAEVVARRAPGTTLDEIVRAMLPCGSVTGAPKVRAMEVIARLEPWRRGAYTGAFGYVARDGSLALAMAIRTLELGPSDAAHARDACYFAGGGIVADSDPARELEETRWKAAQLVRLRA